MRTRAERGGAGPAEAAPAFLLLVLAVLTGLLAMHGLAPGTLPRPTATALSGAAHHAGATAPALSGAAHHAGATAPALSGAAHHAGATAPQPPGAACGPAHTGRHAEHPAAPATAPRPPGDDRGPAHTGGTPHGGGHAEHADAACAASGISGAPVLPALSPAPGGVPAEAAAALAAPPGAGAHGRAPPSLSELQLLRI
ncbi:DUF6153 family protein [Streptomyces sp. NPDC001674]|uniref:DUF6153 family protein n=1 Tax=Streptomyces sp. NPDC001674 TaxID=3154394 RepID=UPI003317044B